ncbi:bacteriophage Gp15 family protein [Ligilactobacillus apodemi]|uniref:bacteriophage Gp15 family protein n=1 Tax=Ligilactobacillus apodemi TaxID=307126 RepID=UPI00214C417A|nr:bacteriophage Gp15 family protein [Ligilactobacillus apodemi]MCR1902290.1 bacteriophage Gp15 family protein [Ligilactobacillus apodemi]
MISLTEKLNTTVEYGGKEYPVNLAFDNVLSFYEMLDDDVLDDEHKFLTAFKLFFGDDVPQNPEFIVSATNALIDYVGRQPYGSNEGKKDIAGNPIDAIQYYSYTKDAEAIFASFMQCYNINLVKELYKPENERLHWDEFKALFRGLSEDTHIMRIIDIRRRPTDDLEGDALVALQEAKDYYALDAKYNVQSQEQNADAAFSGFFGMARHQKERK